MIIKKKHSHILVFLFLALFSLCFYIIKFSDPDIYQGHIYKIIYIHVPNAFSAFLCSFILFVSSLYALFKKDLKYVTISKASAEMGLLFTILTLLTGSVWGKPTWGTWWTWDARLTTTFILGILYCSFLLICSSVEDVSQKIKISSIIGILIFLDVPIIYKSVTWWRTLHQPPSLMSSEGVTMSSSILIQLALCSFLTLFLCLYLIRYRYSILRLEQSFQEKLCDYMA